MEGINPRRISPLHSELEALSWTIECMLQATTCQFFGTDCKDLISMIKDLGTWVNFSTELEEFIKLKIRFTEFSIVFLPRPENVSSDSLAKILYLSIENCITLVVLFQSGFQDHLKLE